MISLGLRVTRTLHQLMRGVILVAQRREQIHAGHGLALEQRGNVIARDLEAGGVFDGGCAGLMRGLFEHGCETEELAMRRFIHDHFLLVFVHGGDPHLA